MPPLSRTGTRSTCISSSSPALMHCCTILAAPTATSLSPATAFACSSARSDSIFGNGQVLVMRTVEDPADPLGQLVSCEQSVGLYNLALAVNPSGLYGVQPRALLGQKAADDPNPKPAPFDLSVMFSEPAPDLLALVPASVVPDKKQNLLAKRLEPFAAPPKKPSRYAAHGPTIHKAQPHLFRLRQKKPVARDGLRIGIVFGDQLFYQSQGLSGFRPAVEGGLRHPAPPGFILETYRPVGVVSREAHQSVATPFFLSYRGSGLLIHRLARSQRTPNLAKVARMVSPETRSLVRPSSKLTSAASSSVHKLVSLPNFRGS